MFFFGAGFVFVDKQRIIVISWWRRWGWVLMANTPKRLNRWRKKYDGCHLKHDLHLCRMFEGWPTCKALRSVAAAAVTVAVRGNMSTSSRAQNLFNVWENMRRLLIRSRMTTSPPTLFSTSTLQRRFTAGVILCVQYMHVQHVVPTFLHLRQNNRGMVQCL